MTTAEAPSPELAGTTAEAARDFDAFISYSHAADGRLAPALQTALQAIGKPWYRRRALRVFRDTTSLSASPELWPTIQRALERSRYFVLLASPDSAASPWVEQEVAWWRAHRDGGTCLIVLTAGELEWDDERGDFSPASSVPASLRGWFSSEPLWVDLRWARNEDHLATNNPTFRDAAASLAAPIRGVDKDELVGEDIRQHRRTIRIARGAVALLTVLTIAAVAAGILAQVQRGRAETQRGRAERQAREATSLALASTAAPLTSQRPDIALPLAFEAYTTSPRSQARSALVSALAGARDPGVVGILHGHTDDVEMVVFSPDGRTLASAAAGLGDDQTIRLWDARTHTPLGVLRGHTDEVRQVAFSGDGRTLASAGGDGTVRLWDVRARRRLGAPFTADSEDADAVLSPSGHALAMIDVFAAELQVWDIGTRKRLGRPFRFPSSADAPEHAAFSPDGRTLATFSPDQLEGTIQLWDLRARKRLGPAIDHGEDITDVTFSRDGRVMASFDDRRVQLWNARRATKLGFSLEARNRFRAVAFSHDGRRLAVADGRTIQVWDLRTRTTIGEPLTGHSDLVTSLSFSPDGGTLASSSFDQTVRLWDLRRTSALAAPLLGHFDWVHSVAFSPDGRTLASAGRDKVTLLWNTRTRREVGELNGHRDWINSVAFSPDGRTLATTADDGTVRLWDARTRKQLDAPIRHEAYGAVFSPDGRTLATAGVNGKAFFWDVRTHKRRGRPLTNRVDPTTGDPEGFDGVVFSPDGRMLASYGETNAAIRLWDVRTRKQIGVRLQTRTNGVGAIALSPDGRTLASGTDDGTIQLWDVATQTRLGTPFTAHNPRDGVASVAFSPDGRMLATASWDHTVRVWDVRTREALGPPLDADTQLSSVAFSPDGQSIAAAGEDGSVWLWSGLFWRNNEELRRTVCSLVGGGLSEVEWSRYASGIPYRNSCASTP